MRLPFESSFLRSLHSFSFNVKKSLKLCRKKVSNERLRSKSTKKVTKSKETAVEWEKLRRNVACTHIIQEILDGGGYEFQIMRTFFSGKMGVKVKTTKKKLAEEKFL